MRARYEPFGGIIALDKPPGTIYVDRPFMKNLGYPHSPLWETPGRHLTAPVTAHFAVTHRCPLGCRTCYNDSGQASPGEFSTLEAKRALDVLARMKVFTVAFGGGEPLARPDIFELANYARNCGLIPTLTTNGVYIDKEISQRCRVFSHIHVSLDGLGEDYEAVRGVRGFQYAVHAIELLSQAGIPIGVNCVVCRSNFDHLEDLAQFLLRRGVKDIIFLRLKPGGRAKAWYEQERLLPEQRRAFYPLLKILILDEGLHAHIDCAMMPLIYAHLPDIGVLDLLAGEGCVAGSEIIEIQPDGNIYPCSFSTRRAGTITQLPGQWDRSPAFEFYRTWALAAPEPCRSCPYLHLCRGGCRAVAETLCGDPDAPDPDCLFIS